MADKKYWTGFYKKSKAPELPSLFAEFIIKNFHLNDTLLELGCGNGRDSTYFSKCGLDVLGIDQCENIIARLNSNSKTDMLKFETSDFTNHKSEKKYHNIYSRFTLHTVGKEETTNTLNWIYKHLKPGGSFFLEARSVKDALCGVGKEVEPDAWFSTHYRRFIRYDEIVKELEAIGFNIVYKTESSGLAPYKNEDPVVIRIVAQKTNTSSL